MDIQSALPPFPPAPPARVGWPWMEPGTNMPVRSSATPRISIVTPSFNQAAFLEETIRSVLLQGYPNLQYIVIDGGSTDGSIEIIRKYAPWLDYWTSEPDQGQSHAINKGLARCDGEWFNWINSDDYLLPGALAAIAAASRSHPSVRMIAGGLRVVDPTGAMIRSYSVKLTANVAEDIVNHRTAQPAMFYRRGSAVGPDETLHFAMDFAMWVQLLAEQGSDGVHLVDQEIAAFRLHESSKTSSPSARFEQEERAILCRLARDLGAGSPFLRTLSPDPGNSRLIAATQPRVDRISLQRVIVRRFLLGDLRRDILAGRLATAARTARVCFGLAPAATSSTVARALAKRVLHASAS